MLLDVRTQEEHAAGAISGSVNVPIDSLWITSMRSEGTRRRLLRGGSNGATRPQALLPSRDRGTQSRRRLQTWSAFVRAQRGPTAQQVGEGLVDHAALVSLPVVTGRRQTITAADVAAELDQSPEPRLLNVS